MTQDIGENVNTTDETVNTIVQINSLTATTVVTSNLTRQLLTITLEPSLDNVAVAIRYYPAADDNIFQGTDVLVRDTMGNTNLFRPRHQMTGIKYTGEISALSLSGLVNLLITEG